MKQVLILSIDTLRADMLKSYGSDGDHMPILDALAARGTVFRNAIAPMATTFPSHSSMFTGLYPRVHGVRWNGDSLATEHNTLAELLSLEGWHTGAFVSYKAMVARGGLDQGFDVISDEHLDPKAERIRSGDEVNRLTFDYLDGLADQGARGEKTFLWLHYFEPHAPYPITPYATEHMHGYDGPLSDGATIEEFGNLNGKRHQSPEAFAAVRALYEGRVRDADRLVGELLEGLEERGLLEDTLIVVIGDHGQLLGEHERVGHGSILWQEVLDVPFLIVDPRTTARGVIEQRVGVVDVMPTVLELLGVEGLEGMQGRSLAAAVRGSELQDQVYFAEVRIADPRQARPDGQNDAVAVFHDHFKFVLESGQEILRDLASDPGETEAIPLDQEPELVELLRPLAEFHRELSPGALGEGMEMSAAMMEELQALGYVDGE